MTLGFRYSSPRRLWPPHFAVCIALLLVVGCTRDSQALKARYVDRADRYAVDGRLAEAVIEYRNALQAVPQDGDIRLKLAEAYLKQGDGGNAAREYLMAADLLLDRADVQLTAGQLLLLGGRFDDARVRAEKALATQPEHVAAHILLANALAGLKDFEAALAQIEEAIRLAPDQGVPYASLGAVEASRGRMEAAEKALKRATELDRTSVAAQLALASFYWAQSRWPDAEQALKRALTLEPDNLSAHRAMASVAVTLNKSAAAEEHLLAVRDLSRSPEAALPLADFYLQRGDEPSARAVLDPLTGSPATAGHANVRLAALDHASGRRDEAHARLDLVLAAEPSHLDALVTKSSMLLSEGRLEEALGPARTAVQSHANAAPAYFALARVERARQQPDAAIAAYTETLRLNPRATAAHVALSTLHLTRGRSAEAITAAEDALKGEPGNPDARLALVRGSIAAGDLKRAQPEIARLLSEFPNSPAVRVQNGIFLRRQKDLTGARREFEHALKLAPDSAEALNGLVALDFEAKQPDAALARINARLDRGNASPAVLMVAARTHLATGDLATAEQLLRRILQEDDAYLAAYSVLSQVHMRQGRVDAALSELDSLAERDPRPVAALTSAGMILQGQGRQAEARQRFERALQIDPGTPIAANNLAWLYAQSGGNLDVALQLAQTAYSKLPDSPEVAHTLGYIYYKKDLLPQAIQLLKITVEKDAANPVFHHHLGLALAKAGDAPAARRHLSRALALKPDFDGASEAKAVLQALPTS
jgi:tetratricopeptide (TPR) repeat protein